MTDVLEELASGRRQPEYVEQAEVGYLIVALLERIMKLEERVYGKG